MPDRRALLKASRVFHLYSGVFLAPAFLFFAFTGGVQTFSLHETTRGSSYKPPAILVKLGQLHKKQTLVVPAGRKPPPDMGPGARVPEQTVPSIHAFDPSHLGDHTNQQKHERLASNGETGTPAVGVLSAPKTAAAQEPPEAAPPGRVQHLLPMKIFFLITAIGFFFSTLTGLYMAYKYTRRPSLITVTLLAGVIIPLLLLLF